MNRIIKQRQWLYLLTALVLLMQSFALWHDASHPFHIASDQCQRFESVTHSPSIDLATAIHPTFTASFSVVESALSITLVSKRLRDNHSIRAPPTFS